MADPGTILIVDDEKHVREALQAALETLGYHVVVACNSAEALARLGPDIDLILVDCVMPGLSGFEVVSRVREMPQYSDVPIIMVTGLTGKEHRLRAVECGANDFIAKPADLTELRVRTRSLLRMKAAQDAIKEHRALLETTVEQRTRDLREALAEMSESRRRTHEAYLDTMRRLAIAAEYRDTDTAAHVYRISQYCTILAGTLGLSPSEAEAIRIASPMHDLGKIGVPDAILLKPGPLSRDEWKIMREHTVIGARILSESPSEILRAGEVIALSHHERWDGGGYPRGLGHTEIPLRAYPKSRS